MQTKKIQRKLSDKQINERLDRINKKLIDDHIKRTGSEFVYFRNGLRQKLSEMLA